MVDVDPGEHVQSARLPCHLPRSARTSRDARTVGARTDANGRLRLQNDSNRFWGYISAWAALALAAVANNRAGLVGADHLSALEATGIAVALFAVSVVALTTLARSHVAVVDGWVTIRNPLRAHGVGLRSVRSLEHGFWGFPRLVAVGLPRIRVFGLGESSKEMMEGGGEDAYIFRHMIASRSRESDSAGVPEPTRCWAIMDRSLGLLLVGWLVYTLSFLVQ